MTEEKENKKTFELVEVATQTDLVIKDLEEDKILNGQECLMKILNELAEIKKILGQ